MTAIVDLNAHFAMWRGYLPSFMRRVFTVTCFLPAIGGLASLISFAALGQGTNSKWVHGSWVNVRATSASTAEILTRVTTNTPVKILAQLGGACEIELADRKRGFLPCNLLGDKPLALNPEEALKSPLRAFWLDPSATNLILAGLHFHSTQLTEAQRGQETDPDYGPPRKLVRFAIPEYEAMKKLLASGYVPARSTAKNWKPWHVGPKKLEVFVPAYLLEESKSDGDFSPVLPDLSYAKMFSYLSQTGELSAVRPSFFKRIEDLAVPSSGLESIARVFQIELKTRVIGGPKWINVRHVGAQYSGAWDVGAVQISTAVPIFENRISRQGLISAAAWTASESQHPNSDESGCSVGYASKLRNTRTLPGYPTVRNPLTWFYTLAPHPHKQAKVDSKQKQVTYRPKNWKEDITVPVRTYEIDLNADGISDLAYWEYGTTTENANNPRTIPQITMLFVSVAGKWYLMDLDDYGWCT